MTTLVPLPRKKSPAVTEPAIALRAACYVVCPVPPLAIATVPVTFVALPEIFPLTCDPAIVKLFALVKSGKEVRVVLLAAVILLEVPLILPLGVV